MVYVLYYVCTYYIKRVRLFSATKILFAPLEVRWPPLRVRVPVDILGK